MYVKECSDHRTAHRTLDWNAGWDIGKQNVKVPLLPALHDGDDGAMSPNVGSTSRTNNPAMSRCVRVASQIDNDVCIGVARGGPLACKNAG